MLGPQNLGFKKFGGKFKVPENFGSENKLCVQRNNLCQKIFCVQTKCCVRKYWGKKICGLKNWKFNK